MTCVRSAVAKLFDTDSPEEIGLNGPGPVNFEQSTSHTAICLSLTSQDVRFD